MTSFVNLMADDVWSDDDIVNRTEAQIASHFPFVRKEILDRKVTAMKLGMYQLTPYEQQQLQAYAAASFAAGALADAARSDMALLMLAMQVEQGTWGSGVVPPEVADLVAARAAHRAGSSSA